jgi:integrase
MNIQFENNEFTSTELLQYLKEKLTPNSASLYFNKVRAAIREAYQKKMIKENPCSRVKGIKGQETRRQYLTLEELQKLATTPCSIEKLKQSFLFSALTGLRWSDVKKLTWDKIKYSEDDGYSIFTQQKTQNIETMPVSEQAIKMLGERKENEKEIFAGLLYNTWMNDQLQKWVNNAGINKKITFHCARHSFATLHLSMNTDIYTVSKLLGHKHLRTTEVYEKVMIKRRLKQLTGYRSLYSLHTLPLCFFLVVFA